MPHPLVLEHPHSGRPALYGVAGTPFEVLGLSGEEGQALLRELKQHAIQSQYVRKLKYRPGDLAIWDTRATLHSATYIPASQQQNDERLLWRISVTGEPGDSTMQPAA